MYVGRFVCVGKTREGRWYLGYRVSSRSFPNRRVLRGDGRATVMPTEDAPPSDNPYIAYNCFRSDGQVGIVANGSHVDPMVDKVSLGYPIRDALGFCSLALDFEHDSYNTPRVTAALDASRGRAYLGIVADDQLLIRQVRPSPGEGLLIATYELTEPTPIYLSGGSAQELADNLFAAAYDHPVGTMVAMPTHAGWELAIHNAR
jgi:IMP cyclohydrolase